jgi:hypothetical protein
MVRLPDYAADVEKVFFLPFSIALAKEIFGLAVFELLIFQSQLADVLFPKSGSDFLFK